MADVHIIIYAIIDTAIYRIVEIENVVTATGNGRINIKQATCIVAGQFCQSLAQHKQTLILICTIFHALVDIFFWFHSMVSGTDSC